jgi:hypothetical protein
MRKVKVRTLVNPETLVAELRARWPAQGEAVGAVWTHDDNDAVFDVSCIIPDVATDEELDIVLAAHDPYAMTDEQAERFDFRDARDTINTNYEAFYADFANGLNDWDTLTAAQKDALMKKTVQVVFFLMKIIRILVRR